MDTPQLFERSPLATNADNPLGFSHSSSTELPLYLVDVNVLKKQGEPANARLAGLVFPDRLRQGTLTANDLSDISHLETSIHHSLSGFITSDEAILRAAPDIEVQYGLRILSPDAFKGTVQDEARPHSVFTPSNRQLELRPTGPAMKMWFASY